MIQRQSRTNLHCTYTCTPHHTHHSDRQTTIPTRNISKTLSPHAVCPPLSPPERGGGGCNFGEWIIPHVQKLNSLVGAQSNLLRMGTVREGRWERRVGSGELYSSIVACQVALALAFLRWPLGVDGMGWWVDGGFFSCCGWIGRGNTGGTCILYLECAWLLACRATVVPVC